MFVAVSLALAYCSCAIPAVGNSENWLLKPSPETTYIFGTTGTTQRLMPLNGASEPNYLLRIDFLHIDGCSCSDATIVNDRLALVLVNPPDLVTPTDEGEVPVKLTPIDGERAARELGSAWRQVIGRQPSDDTLLILAAHWAHETSGGSFMYNYNFAGIKGRGASGLSCLRAAHEGWALHASAGIDRFRAYRSAGEGAADYVSLLARKYPRAIDAARVGDILEYVSALREGGYFTGSAAAYAHSLIELAERGQRAGFHAMRMRAYADVTNTNSRIARH